MFEKLSILAMAQGLIGHAEARQSAIAQNVANADTPGYRARDIVSFEDSYRDASDDGLRTTRSGHLGAGEGRLDLTMRDAPGPASPDGNTVTLETEMLRSADVRAEHDRALAVYRSSMNILRTSLGR